MNKKIYYSVIAFVFTVVASGCATPRQFSMPVDQKDIVAKTCPVDKACLYVVRPATMGGAMHFHVKDNDILVGETGPRSYLAWQREPGTVNLVSVGENTAALGFEAEAGQSYYFLQSVKMGIMTARTAIAAISQDEALNYMKNCKLAKSVK